jgi:hypothetical protein
MFQNITHKLLGTHESLFSVIALPVNMSSSDVKIGINGFGRIVRLVFRCALEQGVQEVGLYVKTPKEKMSKKKLYKRQKLELSKMTEYESSNLYHPHPHFCFRHFYIQPSTCFQ